MCKYGIGKLRKINISKKDNTIENMYLLLLFSDVTKFQWYQNLHTNLH